MRRHTIFLLGLIGLSHLGPTLAYAETAYIQCEFTGASETSLVFELGFEGETVSGISVAAPDWGTMQLDRASSGQLVAHMKHSIRDHPDAVLTLMVNRITGSADLFYSPPVRDALSLFWQDVPCQRNHGHCKKTERAF